MDYVNCFCQGKNMSTLTAPQNVAEPELTEEERKMWDHYEREVLKAIDSDTWTPMTPEYWSDFLRKRAERKAARQTERKS
jgi:hypothetical protein